MMMVMDAGRPKALSLCAENPTAMPPLFVERLYVLGNPRQCPCLMMDKGDDHLCWETHGHAPLFAGRCYDNDHVCCETPWRCLLFAGRLHVCSVQCKVSLQTMIAGARQGMNLNATTSMPNQRAPIYMYAILFL